MEQFVLLGQTLVDSLLRYVIDTERLIGMSIALLLRQLKHCKEGKAPPPLSGSPTRGGTSSDTASGTTSGTATGTNTRLIGSIFADADGDLNYWINYRANSVEGK